MSQRKPLTWLLAASLALNLGMLGAVAWKQWSPQAAQAPQPLTDTLALDAQQRQQWEALERPFLQDLNGNWEQIRHHREALVQAIFASTPDPAAIERKQARIAELQNAQQQRVITQLMAERELLNSEQRARLLALLLSRYSAEPTQEEQLHNK
ncbi:MAG: periplasmic heavy metal sensor [Brachymonas denitrificans]